MDDSKAVASAIKAAHKIKGPVIVIFPAGKFIVRDVIKIERIYLTLRGAGMGEKGTELFFRCLCA